MDGKYIYGIIKTGTGNCASGITGVAASSPVHLISHKDLSCVLSDYSGAEFGSVSREEVFRRLVAHQTVVEHVMKKYAVLPVKFGTLLTTTEEVRQLLAQGYSQFVEALAWFHDKVELEVAATWDMQQVLREISSTEEIIKAREATVKTGRQQTVEQRIRLGQMVKGSVDRYRENYRERMISFLKPTVIDAQSNILVSDELVMNVAFLVEKVRLQEFNNRVSELNDLFHNQFNFRLIGPMPPYSFTTIEVTRLNQQVLEEARQLLCMDGTISESGVRKAYRHLAAETHPDCQNGDTLAKAKFIKLRRAAELLIDYCRKQSESDNGLLINIKCSRVEDIQHFHFAETEG